MTRDAVSLVLSLRSCRVAVVPSIVRRNGETEGMPTVVSEAMAAGARIVTTAVGGIPDVIRHGENGWLCRGSVRGAAPELGCRDRTGAFAN